MAFLQLALPGLLALSGYADPGLPRLPAVLSETLAGQKDWTQFIHGRLELDAGCLHFIPIRSQSRLGEIAHTTAIAQIPEGVEQIIAGSTIMVQVLDPQITIEENV